MHGGGGQESRSPIVRALVQGASNARSTHQNEGLDRLYGTLYASVEQLVGGQGRLVVAARRLAKRPGSRARQERLAEHLARFDAENDPTISRVAAELLRAAASADARSSNEFPS